MPKNGTAWPVRPSRVNEGALDAEPMPRASSEAKKEEPQKDEVDKAGVSEGSEQAD